jgi:hypothetical protein
MRHEFDIRITIEITPRVGELAPPIRRELAYRVDPFTAQEFQKPKKPPFDPGEDPFAWYEFERQMKRHNDYVQSVANQLAHAIGDAL